MDSTKFSSMHPTVPGHDQRGRIGPLRAVLITFTLICLWCPAVHAGDVCCNCDDDNSCTTDTLITCDIGACSWECRHEPNTLSCTDYDVCTYPDRCAGGACVPGEWCPDDDNPCSYPDCEVPPEGGGRRCYQ